LISRGGDEQNSALHLRADCILERKAELCPAPTVVGGNDIHPLVLQSGDEIQTGNGSRSGSSIKIDELARFQGDMPIHSGNAYPIIAVCPDRPGHVRAMTYEIGNLVVDKERPGQNIVCQVRMKVYPGVQNSYSNAAASSAQVPCLQRFDVC